MQTWTSIKGTHLVRFPTNVILRGCIEEFNDGRGNMLVGFHTKTTDYRISGCWLFAEFQILYLHLILGKGSQMKSYH